LQGGVARERAGDAGGLRLERGAPLEAGERDKGVAVVDAWAVVQMQQEPVWVGLEGIRGGARVEAEDAGFGEVRDHER
ncbi:MAG: hypothetical protein IKO43_06940, partial [Kiritimatiellae bacterium]|nr:hypothetical protein [Kiritimatiellia bacterium]